jgi:MATE family multidrug resistance protein
MLFFPDFLIGIFSSGEEAKLLTDPILKKMTIDALMWLSIFFLFDGFSWILIGHLTAAGDTKFIFYVSSVINWVAYVIPGFLLIGLGKHGADVAWQIIAVYSVLNFCIYLWRYRSGRWLASVKGSKESLEVPLVCAD